MDFMKDMKETLKEVGKEGKTQIQEHIGKNNLDQGQGQGQKTENRKAEMMEIL